MIANEIKKEKMEKIILLIIIIALTADVSILMGVGEPEDFDLRIGQSPHNFSNPAWLPISKICHVCHTVHNETLFSQQYPNGLLWKREIDSVVYIMYHSYWGASFFDTRDKTRWTSLTGKRSNLPDGLSKFCLACHDGLIAPDMFILHHFVSAEYDVMKSNLRDPDITLIGMSGSISEVLDREKVQCSSCHDVHGTESIDNTKLLRAEKPEICITCHRIDIKE